MSKKPHLTPKLLPYQEQFLETANGIKANLMFCGRRRNRKMVSVADGEVPMMGGLMGVDQFDCLSEPGSGWKLDLVRGVFRKSTA